MKKITSIIALALIASGCSSNPNPDSDNYKGFCESDYLKKLTSDYNSYSKDINDLNAQLDSMLKKYSSDSVVTGELMKVRKLNLQKIASNYGIVRLDLSTISAYQGNTYKDCVESDKLNEGQYVVDLGEKIVDKISEANTKIKFINDYIYKTYYYY